MLQLSPKSSSAPGSRYSAAIAVTLALSALLMGCDRQTRPEPERFADSSAGGRDPGPVTLTLTGCVEARPGDQFVLDEIGFESERERTELGRPVEGYALTAADYGISEGAWVRLEARGQDLEGHLGERVAVTGTVIASGANTIGRAGSSGYQVPSGERSMAARTELEPHEKVEAEAGRIARQSLANGTAAEIQVQAIRRTGQRCLTTGPDVR